MHDLLLDRTALVAGGTGNVGRVLVGTLLDAGATVVVPSRSAGKLDRLRAEVGVGRGERLIPVAGDIADETDAQRLLGEIASRVGPLDAAVASLGRLVLAPSVLTAPLSDFQHALDSYLFAHFHVARAVIPVLRETGGSYTFINGLLAFEPVFLDAGLISIVTAAQAMLARVVMLEVEDTAARVNEVVLYTRFGSSDGDAAQGPVSPEDIGRYVTLLASPVGEAVRGQTIHLDSPEPLRQLTSTGRPQTPAGEAPQE